MRSHVLAMVLLAGCSGGASQIDGTRNYLHAAVTLTDGRSLTFDQPSGYIGPTQDTRWVAVQASDPTQGFSVNISFDPEHAATTATYNTVFGSYVDVELSYPDTPGGSQTGVAASGRITFDQLDSKSGGVISGTFDNVQLVTVQQGVATQNVVGALAGGSFRALIP